MVLFFKLVSYTVPGKYLFNDGINHFFKKRKKRKRKVKYSKEGRKEGKKEMEKEVLLKAQN